MTIKLIKEKDGSHTININRKFTTEKTQTQTNTKIKLIAELIRNETEYINVIKYYYDIVNYCEDGE